MQSDGRDILLFANGLNSDILKTEVKVYKQYRDQVQDHVSELRGHCVKDVCEALFGYLIQNVQYRIDPGNNQFIKTPARLLTDGYGDCKSMAMYFCCCLHCLGIPHIFRFVNFDGSAQYTHVYAVAIDENGNEIKLDAVERDKDNNPVFNYARPYSRKKDISFL